MRRFDTIAVVDWSGGGDRGPRPVKDAIWTALARGGASELPVYHRNRAVAEDWLSGLVAAELAAGRRLMIGLDFPFGYPAGFAARVTGVADPLALWDWFAARLPAGGGDRFALAAELNGLFPGIGPFWFNGGAADHPALPRKGRDRHGHGLAEKRLAEARAAGAFTVWQMGGAGAVGSQAMTGLAALARLRARFPGQVAAWPFQPLDAPVALVEVWPSLAREAIAAAQRPDEIRDAAQVRVTAAAIARMQEAGTLAAALAAVPAEARTEEGWILGLGAEDAYRAAAAAAGAESPAAETTHEGSARMAAGAGMEAGAPEARGADHAPSAPLVPPRLRDDCFAMPQGTDWVPVDAALDRLRAALSPVAGTETVALQAADGRVLAEDPAARRANPPAANAAVDGYGFAHAATGAGVKRLPLVEGRAAAGKPFEGQIPAGHAVRVLTGAILPEGVDTVVLEEDCATDGASVAFDGPLKPRANTRKAGEDVARGATAIPAGHRLRPPDLALLAAVGIAQVQVRRPLRVAVLSTGDEVTDAYGAALPPHRIYDANRPMLLALARRWGHDTVDLGHAPDDAAEIARRLDSGARDADLILTSGGASAGDEDHVSRTLRDAGRLMIWRIAVKPGRPLAMAMWQGTPVIGLPGNPVAAFVCALIFARPALSLLSGAGWTEPAGFAVPAAFAKSKKPGRREYLRARLTPEGAAEVFRSEGSGRISGLAWATGLVELPDGAAEIVPGAPVRFLPYAGFGL